MRLSFQTPNGKIRLIALATLSLPLLVNGCRPKLAASQNSSAPVISATQTAPSIAPVKTFIGHSDAVQSLSFTRDGKTLATASLDGTVNLWDVTTGKILRMLTANRRILWSVALSPDGKTVASGGIDGILRIWDAESGRLLHAIMYSGMVSAVSFSPDGKSVATGSDVDVRRKTALRIWDVQSGKLVRKFVSTSLGSVKSVAFSPNGKLLLSGGSDKTLRLWDVQTGRLHRAFVNRNFKEKGRYGVIQRVAFSPKGTLIAGGGWGGGATVWIWNARTGALLHTLHDTGGSISGLAFSPDEKTIAGTSLLKMQLWNAQTGKSLKSWSDKNGIYSLAFSPDGKYLVTGGREGDIRINPDGTVTSNVQGTIKFWAVK